MDWHIRLLQEGDRTEIGRMIVALFPTVTDIGEEVAAYYTDAPHPAVFVAERAVGGLGGFIEVGSRSVAEGCTTSPVAYIEAWYVDPDLRRMGVGRALFAAAEDWAREQGFREIGSDTQFDNEVSINAHKALGYTETDRIVCFLRTL